MEPDRAQSAAIAETTSFLRHFKELPDHRQAGKVDCPLAEILLLGLLAVPALREGHALARSSRRYLRHAGRGTPSSVASSPGSQR